MNNTKKLGLRKIPTIIACLAIALSMLMMSSCAKTEDSATSSSSSSSSTKEETAITDFQTITNGDFEFSTDKSDADDFPVATNIGWSRANDSLASSANTSDYSSGIIDTEDETYKAIAEKNAFPVIEGEGDGRVYFNPHTPYYYGLIKDSYEYSEETENKDKLPTTGSKVLMIHNKLKSEEKRGTAQKFTSTKTIDISADTYNKISVWVLTKDLKTFQNTDEFGAYVGLTNTVSETKSPFLVKNINTDGNWAQVNIYLEGGNHTTSAYRVVLGLGFGSRMLMGEYVEGFAYFDNVTHTEITKEEYDGAIGGLTDEEKFSLYVEDTVNTGYYKDAEPAGLKADLSGKTALTNGEKTDAYDSAKDFTEFNFALSYKIPSNPKTDVYGSSKINSGAYTYADVNFGSESQVGGDVFSTVAQKINGIKSPVGNDSAHTIYMILPKGASHTVDSNTIQLEDKKSVLLTFYANVKAENSQTGASVSVIDMGTISDRVEEKIEVKSNFNTVNENNNWVKFFVLVTNNVGDGNTRIFKLRFDFGPTEIVTDAFRLPEGHALFTDFETTTLTEKQYAVSAGASDYSANVTLGAELLNGAEDEETKDTYSFKHSISNGVAIKTGLASSVVGYTGVVADHTMVGGKNHDYSQEETVSGLLNTEYIDAYEEFTAEEKTAIKALEKTGTNNYLQALAIKNKSATAYGYLGSSSSVSANSTVMVSVKLKVFGSAKAYVYLANSNTLEGFDVLGMKAKKYTFENDEITYSDNEYAVDKQYVQTVNATECGDGWMNVNYIITSGINAINYRVEIWNGSRDGSDKSSGLIVVESVTTSTPNVNSVLNDLSAQFGEDTPETVEYTRIPTFVTYTDDNGNEATTYRQHRATTVFSNYGKYKTIVATHATIDCEAKVDETTPEDEETSSDETVTTEPSNKNWTLQIVSIIITVVLIIALIGAIARLFVKKAKREEIIVRQGYSRNQRDITNARTINKKNSGETARASASSSEKEVKEQELEVLPEYDYDNMENNVPQEEKAEKPVEDNGTEESAENTESVEQSDDANNRNETDKNDDNA